MQYPDPGQLDTLLKLANGGVAIAILGEYYIWPKYYYLITFDTVKKIYIIHLLVPKINTNFSTKVIVLFIRFEDIFQILIST